MNIAIDLIESPLLSRKEGIVLRLVAKGMTRPQIAWHLHRTVRTVDGHIERIMEKLDATNAPNAVAKGVAGGVLHIYQTVVVAFLCFLALSGDPINNEALRVRPPVMQVRSGRREDRT